MLAPARTSLLLAVTVVAAMVAAAAAPLADARPEDCAPAATRTARELPLVLPDGTRLRVRDPYGGVLPAARATFRFRVRGSRAGLDRATTVRWYVDNRRSAVTEEPPYVWAGRMSALPHGRHTITVQAFPGDGLVATTSFTLRVSGCP